MKLFKMIYYPVLVVLAIVMLVFSITDAYAGVPSSQFDIKEGMEIVKAVSKEKHSVLDIAAKNNVKNYITGKLAEYGVAEAEDVIDTQGKNAAVYSIGNDGKVAPTFVVQESVLTYDDLKEHYSSAGLGSPVYTSEKLTNIIVNIPGKTTRDGSSHGESIVLFVHYDSFAQSVGATDTGLNIASALLNIKDTVKLDLNNDITFVFADAGNDGQRGAVAFNKNFRGFNRLTDYTDLVVNFENLGTAGTLMLLDTYNADYSIMKHFNKFSGGAYANSMSREYISSNGIFSSIFSDKVVVTFGNIAKSENYLNKNDNYENVSEGLLSQTAVLTKGIITTFGDMGLSDIKSETESSFVSYLGITAIGESWTTYLFGGLILLLLAGFVAANFFFKSYSFKNVAFGGVISALAAVFTLGALFLVVYLTAAMGAGFGVFSFQSIASLMYSNVGVFIASMLIATAASMAVYTLLKWLLKIKTRDVVAGNAVVVSILAAILAFANVGYSVIVVLLAMLSMIVLILTTVFRTKFKTKFAMDMDRLFLFSLPIILSLPLIITSMLTLVNILGLASYPLIFMLFSLSLSFIAPYFNFLDPVLQRLVSQLPERTIRKYRIVEEEVPDPENKNKTITKTKRENFEEKVKRRYRSAAGISVIAVAAFLMFVFTMLLGYNMSSSLSYKRGELDALYDDAMVYSVNYDNNGSLSGGTWIIKDRDAYSKLILGGFDYNKTSGQWTKADTKSLGTYFNPIVTSSTSGNITTVLISSKSGAGAEFTAKLSGLSNVKKITVKSGDSEGYEVDVVSITASDIVIRGKDKVELVIECKGDTGYTGTCDYSEVARGKQAFDYMLDTNEMKSLVNNNTVYHLTLTTTI